MLVRTRGNSIHVDLNGELSFVCGCVMCVMKTSQHLSTNQETTIGHCLVTVRERERPTSNIRILQLFSQSILMQFSQCLGYLRPSRMVFSTEVEGKHLNTSVFNIGIMRLDIVERLTSNSQLLP